MMNDEEKTAAILARTQINYLKQYEYQGFNRLNLNWWNICPEVYNHPSNRDHHYTVTCTVLPGYDYVYNGQDGTQHLIDKDGYPITDRAGTPYIKKYLTPDNAETSVDISGTLPTQLPDDILKDSNIVPVKVTVTWVKTLNGTNIERSYEIINYFLAAPSVEEG